MINLVKGYKPRAGFSLNGEIRELKKELNSLEKQKAWAKEHNLKQKKPKDIKTGDTILLEYFWNYSDLPSRYLKRGMYHGRKRVKERLYLKIYNIQRYGIADWYRGGRYTAHCMYTKTKSGQKYKVILNSQDYYWVKEK